MSGPELTQADRIAPLGIDLGTTFSVVAYVDARGRPTSIAASSGEVLFPSAVFVDEDRVLVCGEAAARALDRPQRYAENFKRDMGRPKCRRPVAGLEPPPEVLSALVLRCLRHEASRVRGAAREAVITVPAYFDEPRRRATQEAGRLAGLEVLDIINEPTAAALTHGWQSGRLDPFRPDASRLSELVLVYDLGGGTFDVSVVAIEGTRFRTLAVDGDFQLGGTDWDARLVEELACRCRDTVGVDPRLRPEDAAWLGVEARRLKHALTDRPEATAECRAGDWRGHVRLTRDEFETLTEDLLERTADTAAEALRRAGVSWHDLSHLLLVGGATRMPMIERKLRAISGLAPVQLDRPDEAVGHGAAIYAAMLQDPMGARIDCELINVSSHSLGVVAYESDGRQVNRIIIPRNSVLPASATMRFRTRRHDQSTVEIPVVEGESEAPEFCVRLGRCVVRDLPAGLAKGTAIEVECRYAANGLLGVAARVAGAEARVAIAGTRATIEEDLQTWEQLLLQGVSSGERLALVARLPHEPSGDAASLIERLDALYRQVGAAVREECVPACCLDAQESALAALTELRRAERAVAAAGEKDTSAALTLRQADLDRARIVHDFTLLVLGREFSNVEGRVPQGDACQEEIHRLRGQLIRILADLAT